MTRPRRVVGRRAALRLLCSASAIAAALAAPAFAAAPTLSHAAPAPAAATLSHAPKPSRPAPAARHASAHASATQPLTPAQIHSAYSLPLRGVSGQTIAVVSAFDDAHAQADLTAYSQQYDLPPCTTANGCLRILNQAGQARPVPASDPTGGQWITEAAIGTEMAHAVCQSCKVMLVQADSDDPGDISAAVQTATHAGATVVETSFTVAENLTDAGYFLDYSSGRAAMVAAAGDGGYTGSLNFPASLPDVLSVGGTSLTLGSGGRYWTETVWGETVSGCSEWEPAPLWQQTVAAGAGCGSMRVVTDVSAVADPGVAVHVTGVSTPGGPWYAASGTSVSAPIIAGVIGLAGSVGAREPQMIYEHAKADPGALHHITQGSNGADCTSVLCRAGPGWNGPTGLGSPNGLAVFMPSGGALSRRAPELAIAAVRSGQVARGFTVQLHVRNENAVAVHGTLVLRRTLSVQGHLRTVLFAQGKLALGPLEAKTLTLTIAPGARALLQQLLSVQAFAQAAVRGPVGPAVTASTTVALRAPGS